MKTRACTLLLISFAMAGYSFAEQEKKPASPSPEKVILVKRSDKSVYGQTDNRETVKKVMEWLTTMGKGPVEPHAEKGQCALDYQLELYDKVDDKNPSRKIYIHLSCKHVLDKKMTPQQFEDLQKIFDAVGEVKR